MRILVARWEIAYHGRAVTHLNSGDGVILFRNDRSGKSVEPESERGFV